MLIDRPRLRRREAARYLFEVHGVPIAPQTLAKYATIGGGPSITYFGKVPLYDKRHLDEWAAEKLAAPVRSTAERKAI